MGVEVVKVAVEVLDDHAAGVVEVVRRVVHLGVVIRLRWILNIDMKWGQF